MEEEPERWFSICHLQAWQPRLIPGPIYVIVEGKNPLHKVALWPSHDPPTHTHHGQMCFTDTYFTYLFLFLLSLPYLPFPFLAFIFSHSAPFRHLLSNYFAEGQGLYVFSSHTLKWLEHKSASIKTFLEISGAHRMKASYGRVVPNRLLWLL